jgi:hypothetical protein
MKREPFLHHVELIGNLNNEVFIGDEGSRSWMKARPECPNGCFGIVHRIKLAWGVFTGKYDALLWGGGQ